MKRFVARSVFCVVLSTGVAFAAVAPAFADGAPANAKHPASAAVRSYRAELRTWLAKRQAIATTFRAAVASARTAFNNAKAQAKTSADRYAASTAFVAAIALAAENRSAALIALGPAPINPNGISRDGTSSSDTHPGVSIKKGRTHFAVRHHQHYLAVSS